MSLTMGGASARLGGLLSGASRARAVVGNAEVCVADRPVTGRPPDPPISETSAHAYIDRAITDGGGRTSSRRNSRP